MVDLVGRRWLMAAVIAAMLVLLRVGGLYFDNEPVTLHMLLSVLLKLFLLVSCTVAIVLLILNVQAEKGELE